jgi:hypothetical protein
MLLAEMEKKSIAIVQCPIITIDRAVGNQLPLLVRRVG